MAQQGPGFDMSKVSTADKIIFGGAIAFIIWVFFPVWYSCCSAFGVKIATSGVSGFHSTIVISWLLAVLAVAEIVISRVIGTELRLPVARGMLHLGMAAIALLFTLIGLIAKPTATSLSWGIFIGLALNLVWAYGAYMMYNEPMTTTPPPPSTGTGLG
jgi:uncharacterized membrane protein